MMPRRLLRLEDRLDRANDNDCIYLEEFDKAAEEQPYIALSYCWGNATLMPKTTKANLHDRKITGLETKSLPTTFRDAIEVATGLGYRYLWIDAICIVQDDDEDWKQEAPRMAVVYGNATCTIHATDAPDSDRGLFAANVADSDRGVLETRAWVTQEQAISPRSLIFTADGVSWECREGQASREEVYIEATPRCDEVKLSGKSLKSLKDIFVFFRDWRIPGEENNDPEPSEEPQVHLGFGVQGDKSGYMPFINAWWEFVSQYSRRNLSYESDRFLAMNGIAAVAQRWAQIRNTWGLWMDFMETELLWYVDSPAATPTSRWLAPTWSWAGTKGGIIKNGFYERDAKTMERAALQIKPQIGIPYGTSFDQRLPIPAWTSRESQSIGLHGDLRTGEITAYLNEDGRKCYNVKLSAVGRWSEEESYDFRPDVPDSFPVGQKQAVVCLLVWHLNSVWCELDEHVNLMLVLKQRREQEVRLYTEDVPEIDVIEERTLYRLGYMETSFKDMRDQDDIHEDLWWKALWLR